MIVEFEDKQYELEMEEITVQQAKVIKAYSGFNFQALGEAIDQADPDALTALYWLMKTQNGERCQIQACDFKMLKFAEAVGAAAEKEQEEADALSKREALREKSAGKKSAPKDE